MACLRGRSSAAKASDAPVGCARRKCSALIWHVSDWCLTPRLGEISALYAVSAVPIRPDQAQRPLRMLEELLRILEE